ncbi:DUF1275 domain-containing protein [Streptomyces kaniharaensis]|uniref:DUF1275 domain-containing protein n=2 Tax=Streptomyces kaniharaensis TaxID=212423 RepID=A0A6N7L1F2_9ACTN|nr:DUF1275 domain-containing protein [Streptomyces kaniharaensis]
MSAPTVSAGAIDAVTFLGLGHAFAAPATGNVLLLGFGVPIACPAKAVGASVIGTAPSTIA